MAHSVQNAFIFILVDLNRIVQSGFFHNLLAAGGQTSNCPSWSEWSPCVWPLKETNFKSSIPQTCADNEQFKNLFLLYPQVVNVTYQYFQEVLARNPGPCGMCAAQNSCSKSQCEGFSPLGMLTYVQNLKNNASWNPEKNILGIAEKPCDHVEQTQVCLVEKLNDNCDTWPPPENVMQKIPLASHSILKGRPHFNCLSINSKCYCCCIPHFPDPCTAQCVATDRFPGRRQFSTWSELRTNKLC